MKDTKRKVWEETGAKVNAITLPQLEAAEIDKCTDPDILNLERTSSNVVSKTMWREVWLALWRKVWLSLWRKVWLTLRRKVWLNLIGTLGICH